MIRCLLCEHEEDPGFDVNKSFPQSLHVEHLIGETKDAVK